MIRSSHLAAAVLAGSLLALPAFAADPAPDPLSAARAARQAGRFDEAAQLLHARLQQAPTDAAALHELGILYAVHGQLAEAAAQFQAALRQAPDQVASRRSLAETLRAADRCPEALVHYGTLAAGTLDDATALRGLALCQQTLGRYDAAIEACREIERRLPGQALATWAQTRRDQLERLKAGQALPVEQADAEGKALFAEKRFTEAAVWFEAALIQAPTADRAYRLAMARIGADDLYGALGALRRALELDPQHPPALQAWPTVARAARQRGAGGTQVEFAAPAEAPTRAIARALVDGEVVLARQWLGPALQAEPKSVVLQLYAGEIALREGQLSKAVQAFRDILAVQPRHPAARKGLAEAYVRQARLQEARELADLPPDADKATLDRFADKRRAEFAWQLRMALDPGLKPLPALADQLAAAVAREHAQPGTAPPPPPPPVTEPAPPPPKGKGKGTGRKAKPAAKAR